jgi:hypothetical protein
MQQEFMFAEILSANILETLSSLCPGKFMTEDVALVRRGSFRLGRF